MMLFFKSWCENIIIGVVVSMIIEMICPERFLKYIKIVVGIYILYLIIAPIIDKVNLETINGFVDDMDVYVSSDSLIEEKESSLSKSNFGNNNLNKTFIDGIEVTIKEKIREEIGYKIELDIEYDIKSFEIIKVKVSSKNIRSIKQENDKNLINNIILDEIDIDEKLIDYDY